MAHKYELKDADEKAREEGVTQAVTGVVRTGEVDRSTYDYTKSIYAKETGGVTNRDTLLKRVNVAPEEFYKYYEDKSNIIPTGYEETARVLAIESKRAAEYAKVEAGEIGFEDFLMDTYGRDLLKSEGIDLSNPMYWYNRYKSGEYDNPLDNDTVYMGILEQANILYQEDAFIQSINTKKLSDSYLSEEIEGLVGNYVTEETFANVFPEVSETMLEAMDNDIDKLLTYYRAGYLQGVFKPYVDVDGDGDYEYALYTDGKLYKVSEDDGQWIGSDTIQINYVKDSQGNYLLNEDGTRRVESLEKAGLFGTTETGQLFNTLTSSFMATFTSVFDIFGMAYAGIASLVNPEKTFGDYFADYEALKNSEVGFWASLGTGNTYAYDEGSMSFANQLAAGVGTVAGMIAQVWLVGMPSMQKWLTKGISAAAKGATTAAVKTTSSVAKKVLGFGVKTAVGAIGGAAVGTGVAAASGQEAGEGALVGAILGGIGGAAFGISTFGVKGASFSNQIRSAVAKFWQLGNRMRQASPWVKPAETLTRTAVWRASVQSGIMLGIRDGLDSWGTLSAGNRIRAMQGLEELSGEEILGKALTTFAMSAATSTLFRAAQGTSFTLRAQTLFTGKGGEAKFLGQVLNMTSQRGLGFGTNLVDTVFDVFENFATMGISSWGRDYLTDRSVSSHIVQATKNPTAWFTSLYIAANNFGALQRVTGQKSIAQENYEAAIGTSIRMQTLTLDEINEIFEFHLSKLSPEEREAGYELYRENILGAYEQARQMAIDGEGYRSARTVEEVREQSETLEMQRKQIVGVESGERASEINTRVSEGKVDNSVNELTVQLKAIEIINENLNKVFGEDTPGALLASAKEYIDKKITETENLLKAGQKTQEGALTRNNLKYYKMVKSNLNSIGQVHKQSGQKLTLMGALFNAYTRDNKAWYNREKYRTLMNDVNSYYEAKKLLITKAINGEGIQDYEEYMKACGKDATKFYGKLLKDIRNKTKEKLAQGISKDVFFTHEDLIFDNIETFIEQAMLEAKKSLYIYYQEEVQDMIKDSEVEELINNSDYFKLSTIAEHIVLTPEEAKKKKPRGRPKKQEASQQQGQAEQTQSQEETSPVNKDADFIKSILQNEENVKKLERAGVIQMMEDGTLETTFGEGAYLRFNKAKQNDKFKNPKLQRILATLEFMAKMSDDIDLDYDQPFILKLNVPYEADKGKETEDVIYYIPTSASKNIQVLTQNLNIMNTFLNCVNRVAEAKDADRIELSLQKLGALASEDTASLEMSKLTDEERAEFKREGLKTILKYYSVATSDKETDEIPINRIALLRLFQTSQPDSQGNTYPAILTQADLTALKKELMAERGTNPGTSSSSKALLENLDFLEWYTTLYTKSKDVIEIINKYEEKGEGSKKKATKEEMNAVKTFILECQKNKTVFEALIKDEVVPKGLEKIISDGNTEQENSFLDGQVISGEIIRETSKSISSHLESSGYKIPEEELNELIGLVYDSLAKESADKYKVISDEDLDSLMKIYTKWSKDFLDTTLKDANKTQKALIRNFLTSALQNPEILFSGSKEYDQLFEAYLAARSKNTVQSSIKKKLPPLISKAFEELSTQVFKQLVPTLEDGSPDYETLQKIYEMLGGIQTSAEDFRNDWDTPTMSDSLNYSSVKIFMLQQLASADDFKHAIQSDIGTLKKQLSVEELSEIVRTAYEFKYSEGTFDVEPTFIVKIDLTEFQTKQFNDAAREISDLSRKAAASSNNKLDAALRQKARGLAPYTQQVIGKHIAQGKTTLSFDLTNAEQKAGFEAFMQSAGYTNYSYHHTPRPDIPGITYNDEITRGVELKLTLETGVDGELTTVKNPQEILAFITQDILGENATHPIQYITSATEEKKQKYMSRMDSLVQDIVYIDDNTIISDLHNLLINAPTSSLDVSGIGMSYQTNPLAIKQGVSGGRLTKYIKLAQQSYSVIGHSDVQLGRALQLYYIAELAADYFTDAKNNTIGIRQTFTNSSAYKNAVETLRDSKLFIVTEDTDNLTLIISPKKLTKAEFVAEAVNILNEKPGKRQNTGVDFRKILPYFTYDIIGSGKYEYDETGARIFNSAEYHALVKSDNGREWSSLGDGGNVLTPLNYILSRVDISLEDLEAILTRKQVYKYTLEDGKYDELNGKTVKAILKACEKSNNAFERALVYVLRVAKDISKAQVNIDALKETNAAKALSDLSTRTFIGRLFDECDGNVEEVYKRLQNTEVIPRYKESDIGQEYSTGETINTTALRSVSTDNNINHKAITLNDLHIIKELLEKFNIDNPDQVKYAVIRDNALLSLSNAIEIVDGKLVLHLDDIHKLSDDAIKALEDIGITIDNVDELTKKRSTYETIDARDNVIEIKAPAALENQSSNSMTTFGFTPTERILARLANNRAKRPNKKLYVKASSMMTRLYDSRMREFINGYISKLNHTVMRTVNNYGSLQVFNLDNDAAFAEFIIGIKNGMDVLRGVEVVSPDGVSKTLIANEHLFKVSEAIMLYTNGVGYSSEFTNTFIYNRRTGEITPFSQHVQGDLDFGRQLIKQKEIYGDDAKDMVLIRVNKDVFTNINNPENKIKLYDLGNEETRASLQMAIVKIANDALETRYRNNPDVPEDVKERLAWVYGRTLTRRDRYEAMVNVYEKRVGTKIPPEYVEKLFPIIEDIQVTKDGLNLREEAYINTIHRQLIGDGKTILTNPQLRELNDLAIFAISMTAMPESLQDAFLEMQTKILNSDTPEAKFVKAYLEGDMEKAKLFINTKKQNQKTMQDIQALAYTLVFARLQGKDLNAVLMEGKTFKSIIAEAKEEVSSNIKISIDGTNEVPLNQVMKGGLIAFDTESAFKPTDNASNNYKDSKPTELAFVVAKSDDTKQLVERGISGTKVKVYIKHNITIGVMGNTPRDSLDPNGYYYTTEEAYKEYQKNIALLDGKADLVVENKDSQNNTTEIIYIIDADKVPNWQSSVSNFITTRLTEATHDATDPKALSSYNFISYNGKHYDDMILKEKLGINTFQTNVDLYALFQKVYSNLVNDTTSLKQEHLERLIDLEKYNLGKSSAHTASHDALVLLALAQEFFTRIEDVNDYTKGLKYDIIDIYRLYTGSTKSDDEILQELRGLTNKDWYVDMDFSSEFKELDGYKNNETFIKQYQDIGDNLTNELLTETRNAYNDLLNDYEMSSIRSKRRILLEEISGRDLDFIQKLANPEFRQQQRDLIVGLYSLVKSLSGIEDALDINTFLKYDGTHKRIDGYLAQTSTLLAKIIEVYKDEDESFQNAIVRFFSLSNDEQVEFIQQLAKDAQQGKINFYSGLQDKEEIAIREKLSQFSIDKKSLDNPEGVAIPKEFDVFIEEFFKDGSNSIVENIRRDARATSIAYQIANAVEPVFDRMFGDEGVFGFLNANDPEDAETIDEIKRLFVTWYGQTPEQRARQQSRDGLKKSRVPTIDSIFNSLMYGEEGYEVDSKLATQILHEYKDRIKGYVSYEKLYLLNPGDTITNDYSSGMKAEDGVIYLSEEKFRRITNMTYQEALVSVYGKKNSMGKHIYMSANRQPSFQQDVVHTVRVEVIKSDKAEPMSMTIDTAHHFFMGDNDGDMVCLRFSKDLCLFGDKISGYVNTPMDMLSAVTSVLKSGNYEELTPQVRYATLNATYSKDVILEEKLKEMYDSINKPTKDKNPEQLISETKTFITKTLVEQKILTDAQAKDFWAYYGVEAIDTRNTGLKGDIIKYCSYSPLIDRRSPLAQNLFASKQLSSQYSNIMALRDTAGEIQKKAIDVGQTLYLDPKEHPFVYTPLNMEPTTKARIDREFSDVNTRRTIVSNLRKKVEEISKRVPADYSTVLKVLDDAEQYTDNGSVFVNAVIQLTQEIVTRTDSYKQNIIDAFSTSEAQKEARQDELLYCKQLREYAKSRGTASEELKSYSDEALEKLSIFELQHKSAYLLDQVLEINRAASDYTQLFESPDRASTEDLLFNIFMERYAETEDKHVLYSDSYGDTTAIKDDSDGKIYLNSANMKVLVIDRDDVADNTLYATNVAHQFKISNVVNQSIPVGAKLTEEAFTAFKRKRRLTNSSIFTKTGGSGDSKVEPFYIIGVFDKYGKPVDDIKDINKATNVVISRRHSLISGGENTTKLAITGSGMGKGLVVSSEEALNGLRLTDEERKLIQKENVSIIMSSKMLKGTKYNPASGTLKGKKLSSKTGVVLLPFTVVEDNTSWSKDPKLKPTDNITITNGRVSAEGMLTIGQYTFGYQNDEFVYNSEGVAKISALLKGRYSKDYNTTNAARLHKVMKVATIIGKISDADWEKKFGETTKQQALQNILFSTTAGSDVTESYINTLIRTFFKGDALKKLQDGLANDDIGKVVFSRQTEENFGSYYLDGIKHIKGMGAKNKRNQYMSTPKENRRYVSGRPSGYFPSILEEGNHDVTSGNYDTLSYVNDIRASMGLDPISKQTSVEATKNGVIPTENQFSGSQPNNFNNISELDIIRNQNSVAFGRGSKKTDFPSDATPNFERNTGDTTLLNDAQLTAFSKAKNMNNRHITRNKYTPTINLKDPESLPPLRNKQVLSYLLGIMRHTGTDTLEIAESFNNNYPNAIVNSSPKTVLGSRGELNLAMLPETSTVPLRDVTSTMYSKLTPTDYHAKQEARTQELRTKIAENSKLSEAVTKGVPSLDEQFKALLNQASQGEELPITSAYDRYPESAAARQASANLERLNFLDEFITPEERTLFKQLFDLDINNKKLGRSAFTSSGIKGSFAVDRAFVLYRNAVKMYMANLSGTEYKALGNLFASPTNNTSYKEFNKIVYGILYMEKYDKAQANLSRSSKTDLSLTLWQEEEARAVQFFKENFGIKDVTEIQSVRKDIDLFTKTNSTVVSAMQTILHRMSVLQAELDRAEGKPEGMAYTLLIDKAANKHGRYLADGTLKIIDMADEKIDIINTIGTEMEFLAKRAAVAQYTNLMKQDGRMANLPVIAKATQLTDEIIKIINELPETASRRQIEQEQKLVDALLSQVMSLSTKGRINYTKLTDDGFTAMTIAQKLTYLYTQLRQEIGSIDSTTYSSIVAEVMNNPNNIAAKQKLDKIMLLNNIMGTISYTISRTPKSKEGAVTQRSTVLKWFSTEVFDKFVGELDDRYTLVDKNGRMLYKQDKKGNITFKDVYSSESMPFLNIEDACLYMLKYDPDVINNPDDEANLNEIKFNIVAGMMTGDIYVMDKVAAEEFGKSQLGLFQNKSMPLNFYKKIAQKLRNIKSALLMSNPIRLVDRIVSQHAFDFGTFAKNDLGAFRKIPQAKREINQFRASKGASMSETMKLFVDVTGYKPNSLQVAGEEGLDTINLGYFKFTNEAFNTQHFESRYAAFLSLYDAAMKNGGNIPSHKAGSAYYKLEEINEYNPVNRAMTEEESFKHNVAVKCMAVISEAIGTSGDMPNISRKLGEYGFMFTTFPLACMRGGVGKLRSLGFAVWDSLTRSTTAESSRKYLFAQAGNMVASALITAIVTLMTVDGQEAFQEIIDKDEATEEEYKQVLETISKYFLSGATIQPVQSILNQGTTGSEYQNTSIGAALYNMFVDPYREAYMDDNEDTNALTATWRVIMENVWSHAPAGKDLIESTPSNNFLQSMETYTNENNTFFENFFRKIGGYTIGSAPASTFMNSYKADSYTDTKFLDKLWNGYNAAIQEAFGNNKQSKSEWRTYNKASSIIYEYRQLTGSIFSGSDDWNDELYSSIKAEYSLLMRTGKDPQEIYDLMMQHLEEGTPASYVRSAIRNCSLTYKLQQLNQEAFVNYLSDSELNVIKRALMYEQRVFPFLQDYIETMEDIYEEEYYDNYYNTYGTYPTPVTNTQRQASYLLNYYKAYNNYSNYNNYSYNRNYTPYTNNYYKRQDYSDTPLDIFKNLQSEKEYQQRQYEYQRNQRRWAS